MKNRKEVVRIGFGSSSLLLVFIVISFVSFAVLSLSSAITDRNLTEKNYQKNLSYYEACNLAEEQISQIDFLLESAFQESANKQEYFEKVSTESRFQIPVSEYQELSVTLLHHYPQQPEDALYEISSFQLVNTNIPEIEEGLPVFQ